MSCGKPRQPERPERPPVITSIPSAADSEAAAEEEAPGAEVAAQALPPVKVPAVTQALVTFLSGEATHSAGGEWEEVEIGLSLEQNETLKVGEDSYCELQFGDVGALRVQADTQVLLKDVFLKPDGSRIGVQLAVGSVLAKVSKLSGDERFQVRTSTAVCGVRGTQFGVTVSDDREHQAGGQGGPGGRSPDRRRPRRGQG